ncbi:MAG TPA: C25 family cysteine peptidase [Saprospiraceae bacterium]|nr:C25 family cysteine peptidase [Saprospiraceae bacterium]HPI05344.1 C25 family cysteine peptidase [Saprospiraceae bacterium]
MKNLFTLLFYSLSVSVLIGQAVNKTRVSVLDKTPGHTVIRLDLTGVDQRTVATPQGEAVVVSMPDGTSLLQAGMPDVPKFATNLLIPNEGAMTYSVLESEYQDFPDVTVAPSKGDLKRTIDPATVPYTYSAVYEHDAFFPGQLAELQQPFVLRDRRGQGMWIYPVQYNPVSRVLRVYSSITLVATGASGSATNEISEETKRSGSRSFRQLYQKTFINYDGADFHRDGDDPEKMLVIAKDEYLETLAPLVEWKRQMGIHTTVVPVSEVGSDASEVYNFVKNYYETHAITYLLLVGGADVIEPEMRQDGGDYSCDNCFGYLDGSDYAPEVFVGRFHADNVDQLKIMVQRNLDYEKTPLADPAQNWCATGMWSASNEGTGIGDDDQADFQQANAWKAAQLEDGYEKYWEFYDGSHGNISPTPGDETADQNGNPINTQLVNLMNNQGVGVYNYTGHGWEQGLVSGNFNVDAVAMLRNVHRYPFCIAVACCAGNFTNNDGGDCLGEAFQRAGDAATGEAWGGIAGYFSSDFQSWAPPMEGQDGMNQYLIDADGIEIVPSVGSTLAYGNVKMIEAYAGGGELMAGFWNTFGDPSTVLRSRLPQVLTASHPGGVFIGANSLSVECPVEGALISLYWQGQTLAIATVTGGIATFTFPALNTVGNMTVTGTQFNYIPYQGNIQVTPSAGAFVVNQSVTLDDSAGNNNQKADYGEAVTLNVALSNVGVEMANVTSASLTTSDDNVLITDGFDVFGDVAAGETVENPAAFAFSVHDDVSDGHVVVFSLDIQFNDNQTFTAQFPVVIQAPKLAVANFQIDDTETGNGDHYLQSGETATITISNGNTGHSTSPPATGQLTTDSPWLNISPAQELGALNAAGNTTASFTVTVAADAPPVVSAHFNYTLTAGYYGATFSSDAQLINPIIETFEQHNFALFPWQMGGNKPWVIASNNTWSGFYCSRSGTITHSQTSEMNMSLYVTSESNVSFARRVSSEEGYDFLRFYIDDVEIGAWSGEVPWGEVSFPVSPGMHELSWIYSKDEVGSQGSDRAWVDEIFLPPYETLVATSTPDPADFKVAVSPNPATDRSWLTLDLPTAQEVGIQIFDYLGRPLRTALAPATMLPGQYRLPLDLSGLPAGIYLIQVQTPEGTKSKKVVKV